MLRATTVCVCVCVGTNTRHSEFCVTLALRILVSDSREIRAMWRREVRGVVCARARALVGRGFE